MIPNCCIKQDDINCISGENYGFCHNIFSFLSEKEGLLYILFDYVYNDYVYNKDPKGFVYYLLRNGLREDRGLIGGDVHPAPQ